MSTREMLYQDIAVLTDDEVEELAAIVREFRQKKREPRKTARGIFHDVANPDLISLEKTAWEKAAVEKHKQFLEEIKRENS